MKYGKRIFQFVVLAMVFGSLSVGCKSRDKQPSNPFAQNHQTAPPPATFSPQAQYLGQTPSVYVPQLPASTYPGATSAPNSIPANVPLPSGTPATVTPTAPSGSYGSINDSGGATLFQTSAASSMNSMPLSAAAVENEWAASDISSVPAAIPTTRETVFQNLESRSNSISMTDVNGIVKTTTAEPETFAVSSSQMITQVSGDSFSEAAPAAVPAQPQSVYAGKYQ